MKPLVSPRRAIPSLTPLIDVVFILLLFFMLTTAFAERRRLDLETTPPGGAGAAETHTAVLFLSAAGELSTLPDRTPWGDAPGGGEAVVRPAPETSLQTLVAALERLAAAGWRTVLGEPLAEEAVQ